MSSINSFDVLSPDGGWREKIYDAPRSSAYASGRAELLPAPGGWRMGCRLLLFRGPFLIYTLRFTSLKSARGFADRFDFLRRDRK